MDCNPNFNLEKPIKRGQPFYSVWLSYYEDDGVVDVFWGMSVSAERLLWRAKRLLDELPAHQQEEAWVELTAYNN